MAMNKLEARTSTRKTNPRTARILDEELRRALSLARKGYKFIGSYRFVLPPGEGVWPPARPIFEDGSSGELISLDDDDEAFEASDGDGTGDTS